jgi:hypothetical protein
VQTGHLYEVGQVVVLGGADEAGDGDAGEGAAPGVQVVKEHLEEEEEEAEEVSVILAPGDCVLHDGCTIHRADANHSRTRHRRALGITYRAVSRDSR